MNRRAKNSYYRKDDHRLLLRSLTPEQRRDILRRALDGLVNGQPIVPPERMVDEEPEPPPEELESEDCGRLVQGDKNKIVDAISTDLDAALVHWSKWIVGFPQLDFGLSLGYTIDAIGRLEMWVSDDIFPREREGMLQLGRNVTYDPLTKEFRCVLGDEDEYEE